MRLPQTAGWVRFFNPKYCWERRQPHLHREITISRSRGSVLPTCPDSSPMFLNSLSAPFCSTHKLKFHQETISEAPHYSMSPKFTQHVCVSVCMVHAPVNLCIYVGCMCTRVFSVSIRVMCICTCALYA